jgi:nicastrin
MQQGRLDVIVTKQQQYLSFPKLIVLVNVALKKTSGILYQTNTQLDLDNFVNNRISGDFALVIPYNLLTRTNIDSLSSTGQVTGLIVLLNNSTTIDQLSSPDSSCPNCQFGLYANDTNQYQWNPQAQNLIEESFEYPIFAIRPEDDTSQSVYNYVTTVKIYIYI